MKFMTVRGPQGPPEAIRRDPGIDTTIVLDPVPKESPDELLNMWAERMFEQFHGYVLNKLGGLRDLNQALLRAGDCPEPAYVGSLAALAYDISESEGIRGVPGSEKFRQDLKAVHSLLVAAIVNPRGNNPTSTVPQLRRDLVRLARVTGLIQRLAVEDPALVDAAAVERYLRSAVLVLPSWFPQRPRTLARVPAMADLLVVRLGAAHYELGEVAHVENVLGRELRSRSLQRTDLREVTTHELTETTTTTEQDNQTTQRSELQTELQKELQQSQDLSGQVSVSGSYGPTLTVNANAAYASHNAETQSNSVSAQFAQQITTRAAMRVQERVLRERTELTRTETIERNTHEFDNRTSPDAVVGIYRWLEKVHDAQVYSLGKRLLLEVVVPEPAAWLKWSASRQQHSAVTEPCPKKPTLSPGDINEANYLRLVQEYEAVGIEPPDPPEKWIGTTLTVPTKQAAGNPLNEFASSNDLKVPPGYVLERWFASIEAWGDQVANRNAAPNISISVASCEPVYTENDNNWSTWKALPPDHRPDGVIPVLLSANAALGAVISVTGRCIRTPATYAAWQLSVYTAIMRAYYDQKARYDQAIAQAQQDIGIPAMGTNEAANRQVEARELRRAVLRILLEGYADAADFDTPAVYESGDGEPMINPSRAAMQQKAVQFMEQGFEWQNMTYVHYPYAWARHDKWAECAQIDNLDPLFARFLSAGATRVVIPVRPGFESAVSLYLATGLCWEGGDVPTVGDPMYVSAVQEIADQDQPTDGRPIGDSWKVHLPTTLVMLQPTPDLP